MKVSHLIAQGELNAALKCTIKYSKKDKKEATWYFFLDDIYAKLGDDENRIKSLKKGAGIKKLSQADECKFRLAQAYFDAGQYENAKATLLALRKTKKQQYLLENCAVAAELREHPIAIAPHQLSDSINTPYDNIWPSLSADEAILTTTVVVGKKGFKQDPINIQEDIFQSNKVNKRWQTTVALPKRINTPENEGAGSFSADARYMFFVACNRAGGVGSCDIYYSLKIGDIWSVAINAGEPLNTPYWESTPIMAASGEEIFFSSNRPGGKGKKDIWRCKVEVKSTGQLIFSEAENLGDSINTPLDEISPFLHSDNETLYFSSNGLMGMGKLDVYKAKRDSLTTWKGVKNLGYPLNTHKDEFGFIVNTKGDVAYLSSDEIKGEDSRKVISELKIPKTIQAKRMQVLKGIVIDHDTRKPLYAKVDIYDPASGASIFKTYSNSKSGQFMAVTSTDHSAGFNVQKRGYLIYSKALKAQNIENDLQYIIELKKIKAGESMVLRNVYFDVDKYLIKRSSFKELNELTTFLKKNPSLHIEVEGHTDNSGNDAHNLILSDNRAKAIASYFTERGISSKRISTKAYGANRPMATNETEKGRKENRRIELRIK